MNNKVLSSNLSGNELKVKKDFKLGSITQSSYFPVYTQNNNQHIMRNDAYNTEGMKDRGRKVSKKISGNSATGEVKLNTVILGNKGSSMKLKKTYK